MRWSGISEIIGEEPDQKQKKDTKQEVTNSRKLKKKSEKQEQEGSKTRKGAGGKVSRCKSINLQKVSNDRRLGGKFCSIKR